jgi:hypothetical protein
VYFHFPTIKSLRELLVLLSFLQESIMLPVSSADANKRNAFIVFANYCLAKMNQLYKSESFPPKPVGMSLANTSFSVVSS